MPDPLEGENLLQHITLDSDKCGGNPCIRHMRIKVIDVLEMLASGVSKAEILEDYPYLESEDISAVILYAKQDEILGLRKKPGGSKGSLDYLKPRLNISDEDSMADEIRDGG